MGVKKIKSAESLLFDILGCNTFNGRKLTRRQRKTAAKALAVQTKICCLCGGIPDSVGIFIPHKPYNYVSSEYVPGKVRIIPYGLCARCRSDSEYMIKVEKTMEIPS